MNGLTYILKADDLFWTGDGWSGEYPNAFLFSRCPNQKVIDKAAANANDNGWNGTSLEIFRNYGMEDQESFDAVPSDGILA